MTEVDLSHLVPVTIDPEVCFGPFVLDHDDILSAFTMYEDIDMEGASEQVRLEPPYRLSAGKTYYIIDVEDDGNWKCYEMMPDPTGTNELAIKCEAPRALS